MKLSKEINNAIENSGSDSLISVIFPQFLEWRNEAIALEADNARLRKALKWALDYISDGQKGVPKHDCEFYTNPECGKCDFHTDYSNAIFALKRKPKTKKDNGK